MATEENSREWREWLTDQAAASTMSVKVIPFTDINGWGVQEQGGRFGRPDHKFWGIIGLEIKGSERTWHQPILEEYGEGVVLLIADEEDRFLLRAHTEPGNDTPGRVLLAAPLQASRSNLEQVHGGAKPPRAELLDGHVTGVRFMADGGKFIGKRNAYYVVHVTAARITPLSNERWFTRTELRQAMHEGALNEHLLLGLALAFV